jgi:filamentous hemagglutinin
MKFRAYWTDIKPSGPLQSAIDSALLPRFGNAATKVVEIEVPAGRTVFEGFAAEQNDVLGGISRLGGGRQIVIRDVDPSWEVK